MTASPSSDGGNGRRVGVRLGWDGAEASFKIDSAPGRCGVLFLYPRAFHKGAPSGKTLNLTKTKEVL